MDLNYKVFGSGPPVVILHGLFGMLDNLQVLARRFEQSGYMVYLIDQRDHGRSPHTHEFDYHVLGADLHDFLESQWLHQIVLIGHSMGGKTAMQYAADYNTDIRRLIVVDIAPKRYPGGHELVFDALNAVNLSTLQSRQEAENILRAYLHDEGTVQFLMKNLSRNKEGGFEWKMNLPLLQKSYPNIIGEVEIQHPVDIDTLFIRGEKSNYITDEDIREIPRLFPHAVFETIPGAGHWVHVDAPDALFRSILRFIET
jgi:pimeloyl-ACP methyl ester carboxylesterase